VPCTPRGCIELLHRSGVKIAGGARCWPQHLLRWRAGGRWCRGGCSRVRGRCQGARGQGGREGGLPWAGACSRPPLPDLSTTPGATSAPPHQPRLPTSHACACHPAHPAGKKACVIGRSNIVGMPAALLLQREDATVTIVHSRTPDGQAVCAQADIVIAACGKAEMITGDWIKPGAVVIDVGGGGQPPACLVGGTDRFRLGRVRSGSAPEGVGLYEEAFSPTTWRAWVVGLKAGLPGGGAHPHPLARPLTAPGLGRSWSSPAWRSPGAGRQLLAECRAALRPWLQVGISAVDDPSSKKGYRCGAAGACHHANSSRGQFGLAPAAPLNSPSLGRRAGLQPALRPRPGPGNAATQQPAAPCTCAPL
jgi:hypothetical protein